MQHVLLVDSFIKCHTMNFAFRQQNENIFFANPPCSYFSLSKNLTLVKTAYSSDPVKTKKISKP